VVVVLKIYSRLLNPGLSQNDRKFNFHDSKFLPDFFLSIGTLFNLVNFVFDNAFSFPAADAPYWKQAICSKKCQASVELLRFY